MATKLTIKTENHILEYEIVQGADGRYHPYIAEANINVSGRETGGWHWHGISMVGFPTIAEAKRCCRNYPA